MANATPRPGRRAKHDRRQRHRRQPQYLDQHEEAQRGGHRSFTDTNVGSCRDHLHARCRTPTHHRGLRPRGARPRRRAAVHPPYHDLPPARRRRGGARRGRHLRPRGARRAAGARPGAPAGRRVDVRRVRPAPRRRSTSSPPASRSRVRTASTAAGAIESAALDLALRQAGRSLADVLEREPQPVEFVVSMRLGDPPSFKPVADRLEVYPWLRFKLDGTPDWSDELIEQLVADRRDRLDRFQGRVQGHAGRRRHRPRLLPPHRRGASRARGSRTRTSRVPEADSALEPHRDRITWDAPIHSVADIEALAFPPKTVNVKPSRFGSVEGLFAGYDYCDAQGIEMYGGGQIELGVGRGQIQAARLAVPSRGRQRHRADGLRLGRVPPRPRAEPARSEPRVDRHAAADVESFSCRPSSARSRWKTSPRSRRCRSSRAARTRSSRPRPSSAPPPRRSSALAPPSGWTPSARASTSAPRSPPRARRSGCSCAAWPRRRWRWPSAAPATSRWRPRSSARRRRPTASCWRCASWASSRRRRDRAIWLRIRGILLIIFLVIALLALGWGLVQLVSLPFGGIGAGVSIFWGFLVVCVALGVLFLVGRRRQKRAREKQAEQRAQAAASMRR